MKASPPIDPPFSIIEEPEICPECNSGSRLANGLCLNCLLRGALDDDPSPTGKDAFKEVLAAVKSRDGDWSIGEHEIIEEIARGGMGVIYRARDPHSGRIVALKCILAYQGDSDQAQARFRREAETASRLDHPNIVPIYHVGETADGSPFFTMKYATNGSLLQARCALSEEPRESVLLMAKVAQAVQYAHEKGVLHRDLKPGNVLLDARGEPLVSDFGLAHCEEIASHLTRSFTSFGTPGYIAPEQADGPAAQLTAAADIYSLGAILFELLAGRLPFLGDNAFGVMKQSAEKPAPKLRTLAPHLNRDLETICARCLERDPSARYRSAGSLAQDLLNWLEGRPILARPVGLWLHSHRWVKTNRRLAALLAALVVLATVAIGWRMHGQKLQAAMQESLLASRSIAVAPLLDLDNPLSDPIALQTLAASLQDRLNRFGPARVTIQSGSPLTWATTEDIRRAGQQAKARVVLTGTFRMVQGKQRVSFRLVDPASGVVLFTHLSEENGQQDPARFITEELGRAMYGILAANDWSGLIQSKMDSALRNDLAKEAITAARLISHSTASDCDKAIALFKKALQVVPNSSLVHSYLAIEATGRTHYNPDRRFLELGRTEAEIALRLSPGSSEAHRALAGVYYQEGRFSEAFEEGLQTIEIGGLQERAVLLLGMTLDALGRPHQALGWYRMASQLASSPGEVDTAIGDCWTRLGDDEQAMLAYKRATELRPHSLEGNIGMARLRLLEGNFEAAREIYRALPAARGETNEITAQIEFFARNFDAAKELYAQLEKVDLDGGGSFYGAVTFRSALGRAKQALGENQEARILLERGLAKERAVVDREPENAEAVYRLSAIEASLGMLQISLSDLRKAVTLGWVEYRSLGLDPRFDALRPMPEFKTIIDELSAKVADMKTKAQTKE
jgi:tetratricopeptide (TPR) repeat protein/TolB-like protein/tRNA A-37 threonylcarbamoyl transferase component Bud32